MTRPFDFSQAPSDGIIIWPDLPPAPTVGHALVVDAIKPDGRVQLAFAPAGGAFLLLSGGQMTGPLLLAADPLAPMEASTRQYVDAKASETLGTVAGNYLPLFGGQLTGPLLLPLTPPTNPAQATTKEYVDNAILSSGVQEAPNDGWGYLRLSQQWTRAPYYNANRNVGIAVVPPAGQAVPNAQGGWTFQWGITANNWATNGYYDGTTWRYLADGPFAETNQAGGEFNWQTAPSGLKDAAITPITRMSLDGAGNLSLTGNLAANGGSVQIKRASDARWSLHALGAPANQKIVDAYVDPNGNFNMQFVNDAFNAGNPFFAAARTGHAVSSVSLTAPTLNMAGHVVGTGNIGGDGAFFPSAAATNYGFALYGDATYRYIRFTTDNWRLMFNASDGNLQFSHPSGQAQHVWYGSGTFWARGDITANLNMYTNRMHATNGVMSVNGKFLVGNNDAYRLERDGNNAVWYFYENNQWNFQVQPNGDANARGTSYGATVFSQNNIHWGNDWAHILGNGANGQYMQFAPGHYWTYNNGDGTMLWVMANLNQWVIHSNSSCYNDRNWTGGRGPYVDISDIRGKRDIEPATYGLAEVMRLKPIRFRRIRDNDPTVEDREEVSFSAQDVREVIPHAIFQVVPPADASGHCDEPELGLATTPIVAALVRAVQELTARIEELEATV